ncbi:AraC family transcriptional regulator [Pseudomonas sp. GCM10022188]|uniref:AraC family transcriptional regulator n=1 Tax=Pseudomonas TaxID=286 RepID=UPI001E5F3926|nr:AraC family transcriptional regulator [Pseudomonas oryzagri]MCC6075419.1 AraC family transcriptional regulator [Pseudomonas oryzagri]
MLGRIHAPGHPAKADHPEAPINTDSRYIVWLLDFLQGQGIDSAQLARRHRLDGKALLQPDTLISAELHRALLLDALQLSGNGGLGLQLGIQRSLATLDQLGYLMMSSSTLREASEIGLRYQNYPGRFSGRSIVTAFSEIEGQGCYQVHVQDDLGPLRLLAVEDVLGSIVATARWVLGRPLPVTRLRCDFPAPAHAEQYRAVFGCPIQFDAPTIQLFFDAAILDQPLPHASPQSAALYAGLCERRSIERNQGDVAWRLSQMIVANPAEPPDLAAAASALHCSPRTLSRKLLAQGWQYQQLVDQVREIHARRALSDPTQSITRIAQQLGYADNSGFFRAFKKWTGLSPSAFRERLLG